MKKQLYVVTPSIGGKWMVSNLNGRGRTHGAEIVADGFASKADAEAWVNRAKSEAA